MNAQSQLLTNGNFELGNTGFVGTYVHSPNDIVGARTYDVTTDPHLGNSNAFSYGDHTTGSGLMLAVNGSTNASDYAWSETVTVFPNTTYEFSGWVSSWGNITGHGVDTNPPVLRILINGQPQGSDIQVTPTNGQWQSFSIFWNSQSSTQAVIEIHDENTAVSGNDYALDDLIFMEATNSCDPVPAGLIAWWPGDGNANNIVGGDSGILENGAGFTAGEVGLAFQFDGFKYVKLAPLTLLDFTVEFWMKASSYNGFRLISNEGCGDIDDWGIDLANEKIRVQIGDEAAGTTSFSYSTSLIQTNVLYHIAVTRSTEDTKTRIYINGVIDATNNAPHNRPVGGSQPKCDIYTNQIGIGNLERQVATGEPSFTGFIDEVSVYNRVLSNSEIAAIYAAGAAGKCRPELASFTGTTMNNGALSTSLIGLFQGQTVILQSSSNLINWTPVQTNIASGPTLSISNIIDSSASPQFLRALIQ